MEHDRALIHNNDDDDNDKEDNNEDLPPPNEEQSTITDLIATNALATLHQYCKQQKV